MACECATDTRQRSHSYQFPQRNSSNVRMIYDGPFSSAFQGRKIVERLIPPPFTPLTSRRSMVWCPWLCARRCFVCRLKLLNTPDHLKRKPYVVVPFPASPSARSYPLAPACPGQYIYRRFRRCMSNIQWHMLVWASHSTTDRTLSWYRAREVCRIWPALKFFFFLQPTHLFFSFSFFFYFF